MQGGASASLSLWKRPLTGPKSGFRSARVALSPQAGRGKSHCSATDPTVSVLAAPRIDMGGPREPNSRVWRESSTTTVANRNMQNVLHPKTRGSAMRSLAPLGMLGFVIFASPFADAATISGTVTGPDGAPFRGAFVQARHAGLKLTVSVLSCNQGRFLAQNLPAGEYTLQVRAVSYK